MAKISTKGENSPEYEEVDRLYNEDSAVARKFEDGTGYLVVGDGEGSTGGNSEVWTHLLCEEMGRSLDLALPSLTFDPADRYGSQQKLTTVLEKGYERAVSRMHEEHPDFLAGEKPKEARAALTMALTRNIPGTNDKIVMGINCYDCGIAVWDPKEGKFTRMESSQEATPLMYTKDSKSWKEQSTTMQDKEGTSRTNFFHLRVPQDAVVVGFSDGVPDCFYNPDNDPQSTIRQMSEVVRNPLFDSPVKRDEHPTPLPGTEPDWGKLREGQSQSSLQDVTQAQMATRLLNYTQWKTSENRDLQSENNQIFALQNSGKATKYGKNIQISFKVETIISKEDYEAIPSQRKGNFTALQDGTYKCHKDFRTDFTAITKEAFEKDLDKGGVHKERGLHFASSAIIPDKDEFSKQMKKNGLEADVDNIVLISQLQREEVYDLSRKIPGQKHTREMGAKLDDVVVVAF